MSNFSNVFWYEMLSKCSFGGNNKNRLCSEEECECCTQRSLHSVIDALRARSIAYVSDTPARQTFIQSKNKRSWLCLKPGCGHTWIATCSNVCGKQQGGCPFCCVPSKLLCPDDKECVACLRKTVSSVTSTLLAHGILYNSDSPASQTFLSSMKKRLWLCLKSGCGHTWTASCSSVCGTQHQGCPFCSSKVLCPADKECDICASKSVHGAADALRSRSIAYNSSDFFPARETFLNCRFQRSWICLQARCGYVWEAAPNTVCGRKQSGCPNCRRKTEAYLLAWLQATFGATNLSRGKTFNWCKHKKVLPFDYAVCIAAATAHGSAQTTLVELDGVQHFSTLKHHGGRTSDDNRARDVFKSTAALRHGFSLVRIAQEDVWQDSWPVWRTELEKAIRALSQPQMGAVGDRIVYLSSDPALYDAHKRDQVAALADTRALEDMLSTLPDDVLEGDDNASDAGAPTPSPSSSPADERPMSEADAVAEENVVAETSYSAPTQSTTPPDTLAGKKRRASGCASLDAWLRTGSTKSQRTTHSSAEHS
jgi:hypothetical protein